jgi:glycerol-3-phosphate cytidylyltransferase
VILVGGGLTFSFGRRLLSETRPEMSSCRKELLMTSLASQPQTLRVLSPTDLFPSLDRDRQPGELIGYTAGVFDMLHVGHLRLLQQARAQCDRLIVAVTTDELCASRKHKTPVIPFADRVEMLRGLRCVDEVVPQDRMDRVDAWRRFQFGVTFVGDDWKGTESWNRYETEFAQLGVQVVYFKYTNGVSSTFLRQRLALTQAA